MSLQRPSKFILAIFFGAAVYGFAELSGSYIVPIDHDAIRYAKTPVDDPVHRLGQRVAKGEVKLGFADDGMGHLQSLLKELDINLDSQVFVFSKTSFQAPRISPRLPRAIYFNDNVSVGWVRGGDVLELAALDPKQGVIFYTLDIDDIPKPRFRELLCGRFTLSRQECLCSRQARLCPIIAARSKNVGAGGTSRGSTALSFTWVTP
jgi:hypothetical protein